MIRRRHLLLVALVALAVAAPAWGAATPLAGTVGPGFTITLKTASGTKVTKLKPGSYVITVRDKSNIHNFALKGSGVARDSGVPFVGTKTWNVRLKRGKYTFVCTPHASAMKGSFTVR